MTHRVRLPFFLLFVLAAIVLGTFAVAAIPSDLNPCNNPACDCGCKDGGNCNRCAADAGGMSWRQAKGDADAVLLWQISGGRWSQLGCYRTSSGEYLPLRADGTFGEACEPPLAVPERWRRHPRPRDNYGMDWKPAKAERWTVNGVEVPRDEAAKAIKDAGPLPDDGKLPWVIWVGDEATGQKILADVADKARFQSYRPGEPMTLDRTGTVPLYTGGLWFVATDGSCRHEPNYAGTPQVIEGIRQASNGWDASKVPPLSVAEPPPQIPDHFQAAAALAAGGLVVVAGSAVARAFKPKASTA